MAAEQISASTVMNDGEEDGVLTSPSRRNVNSERLMSLKKLAVVFDLDRNTISKDLQERGAPYVEHADRDTGKSWLIDSAEYARWRERRAAESAAEKLGGNGDQVSEAEGKRRRAVAQAIIYEAEALEILKTTCRWQTVVDRVAADYAELRGRLSGVGDSMAGKVDRKIAPQIKKLVDAEIANALTSLRVDQQLAASQPNEPTASE